MGRLKVCQYNLGQSSWIENIGETRSCPHGKVKSGLFGVQCSLSGRSLFGIEPWRGPLTNMNALLTWVVEEMEVWVAGSWFVGSERPGFKFWIHD